jgi:hypothetical protein
MIRFEATHPLTDKFFLRTDDVVFKVKEHIIATTNFGIDSCFATAGLGGNLGKKFSELDFDVPNDAIPRRLIWLTFCHFVLDESLNRLLI